MKVTYFGLAFLALLAVTLAAAAGPSDTARSRSPSPSTPSASKQEPSKGEPKAHTQAVNATSTPPTANQEERCKDINEKLSNGTWAGWDTHYDLEKILLEHGGYPGKIPNTTWTEKESAPVDEEDLEERPLPDAEKKYWLYTYGATDYRTYIRVEHAVHRFKGTDKAFTEIRGTLYFTPDDFCGKSRVAFYYIDDRGFTSDVRREYCDISPVDVTCTSPLECTSDSTGDFVCVAAPSAALLASLVG